MRRAHSQSEAKRIAVQSKGKIRLTITIGTGKIVADREAREVSYLLEKWKQTYPHGVVTQEPLEEDEA